MCWHIETMAFGAPHYLRRTFEGLKIWTAEREEALRFDPIEDAERALDRLRGDSDPAIERDKVVEFDET